MNPTESQGTGSASRDRLKPAFTHHTTKIIEVNKAAHWRRKSKALQASDNVIYPIRHVKNRVIFKNLKKNPNGINECLTHCLSKEYSPEKNEWFVLFWFFFFFKHTHCSVVSWEARFKFPFISGTSQIYITIEIMMICFPLTKADLWIF